MKHSSSIFILIILSSLFDLLDAQVVPSINWQKCYGGHSPDDASSLKQCNDGGFIVVGASGSNDGDVSGNHSMWWEDIWVVRIDIGGNLIWQKCLGGSAGDIGTAIAQTSDAGFIICGLTNSNDGDVTSSYGYGDEWVVKLNANGDIKWQRSLGGSSLDFAQSVQEDFEGDFIIAGKTQSNDIDVSGNHGYDDYWIVKLDTIGNILWQKCFGGFSSDEAAAIQVTFDKGLIIAGESSSNDGDVTGNHGGSDYWIVRLDSIGNLVWQKSFGGSSPEFATCIQQTIDGGFIVAGDSWSDDGDVSGHHGSPYLPDFWVVRLDSNGNLIWQKSLGGSSAEVAYSVLEVTDGGFVVAGQTNSNDGDVSGNHGYSDYWIVKLDANGNLVWQKTLGGSEVEIAYSVQQTTDNGFIVAGWTNSNDGDVSGNHGSDDYWVVKLGSDNAVSSPSLKYLATLSPNPVQNLLTIDLENQINNPIITVYDLQGRMISLPTSFQNNQAQLNTSGLADGFYTLQIVERNSGKMQVGKFVKEK